MARVKPGRRAIIALTLTAALASLATPAEARPSADVDVAGRTQFTGVAYGSSAFVSQSIKSGKSALVTLGSCGTVQPPLHRQNGVG